MLRKFNKIPLFLSQFLFCNLSLAMLTFWERKIRSLFFYSFLKRIFNNRPYFLHRVSTEHLKSSFFNWPSSSWYQSSTLYLLPFRQLYSSFNKFYFHATNQSSRFRQNVKQWKEIISRRGRLKTHFQRQSFKLRHKILEGLCAWVKPAK